jgi:hypothetical protein
VTVAPNPPASAGSLNWWVLIFDGALYAVMGVLVRELFFAEYLERFPPDPAAVHDLGP